MKKLVIILLAFFIAVPAFAENCEDALEESTELLIKAGNRIDELEAKIEKLESDESLKVITEENAMLRRQIISYEVALVGASQALSESNDILLQAYNRIDSDGKEISELREHIKNLIKAGVEIKTYDWNVIITSGYPFSLGVLVGYNFPFFTNLGIVAGIDYNIDTNTPAFKAGIKINIGKD